MRQLLSLLLVLGLFPLTGEGAPTERGLTIEYTEPTSSACAGAGEISAPFNSLVMELKADGSGVFQNTPLDTLAQEWTITEHSPGVLRIQSALNERCLASPGSTSGTPLIMQLCDSGSNQQFHVGPSPSMFEMGNARHLCMNVPGVDTQPGKHWQQYTCGDSADPNELFTYSLASDCALDDLAGTKIYINVILDGETETSELVPATSPTGGGDIVKELCVPIKDLSTDPNRVAADHIKINVTAFDDAGNESQPAGPLEIPVAGGRDCSGVDTTPPGIPQNLRFKDLGGS